MITYEYLFICSIVCDYIITGGANPPLHKYTEVLMAHEEHKELVQEVKGKMPNADTLFDLADFFKVFGDSTRIRIMCALFERELSVCCIADIVGMEQSTVSHQLRVLRQENLVKVRREGKQSYYSLEDEHIQKIFEMGLEHILE